MSASPSLTCSFSPRKASFYFISPRKASFYFFSPKKLVWLFMPKKVKPSPNGKMIKLLPQEAEELLLGIIYKTDRYFETLRLLTLENFFPPLRHSY